MKISTYSILIFMGFGFDSAAAVTIDSSACMVIFDDKQRLECFDGAVKAAIDGKKSVPAVPAPAAVSVSPEPIPPKVEASFKAVDPRDVQATPDKWKDRGIQFNKVQVYWVADDDVRILTGTNLTLFARNVIGPPEAVRFFKQECETSREAFSGKCRAAVRFSYFRHGEDQPNGYQKRVVLQSKDLEFVRLPQGRRR